LSPQQQEAHRVRIGANVRAMLRGNGFWIDGSLTEYEEAMQIKIWIRMLENCSHSEIEDAWFDYIGNPNNRTGAGRLIQPDPGAIRAIILAKRPKPQVVVDNDPEEERGPRMTPEQRDQILREAGMENHPAFRDVVGVGVESNKKFEGT